jgi:uncharacterized protein (TIGR02246 family)
MIHTVVIIGMLACLPLGQSYSLACDGSDSTRALCDAEAALTEALRRNDAIKLSEIYDDEFQLINFRGTQVGKTAVLASIRSGAFRFEALSTSELQVRIYGSAGVITGRQHQVAREPGGDQQAHPNDVRFTHVYVLRDGRWRLMASQITPIVPSLPRP